MARAIRDARTNTNSNFFTISFPVANGVHVNTATEPTIDNGTFQNPISGGILLNLNNATVLPTTLNNLTFNGTPGDAFNVSADGNTDPVTFVDFLGTLANTATVAEDNDNDNLPTDDKLTWFNYKWYSNGNNDPADPNQWWSAEGGAGSGIFNPTVAQHTTNSNSEFIVVESSTYVAQSDWTTLGEITIQDGGTHGKLNPGTFTISVDGDVDNDGEIEFTGDGTFDANGGFLSSGGTGRITFHTVAGSGGTLQLA